MQEREMQKVRMQENRDTVKEGFRSGRIHDRRDTGKVQDWRDSELEGYRNGGFRIGGMLNMRDAGKEG